MYNRGVDYCHGTENRKDTDMPKTAQDRTPQRFTVQIDSGLLDRVRDAAWHSRMTLTAIATDALQRELVRLEKRFNEGQPFPRRSGPVKTGRPFGS